MTPEENSNFLERVGEPVGDSNGSGPLDPFPLTDLGNAERLVAMHGSDVRYAAGIGWLVWDGRRFTPDDTGELLRRAKSTARAIYHDAANCDDDEERKRIAKWARASESEPRLKAMVSLAASEQAVVVRAGDLDADPFALTVLNGTLDLRTGKLKPHNRNDLITKLAPVRYDPDARSDQWERFLKRVTADDVELLAFVQRLAGYTITGVTDEEILAFLHGPGATGKTTAVEAIKATLGDYASTSDFETFLARRGDAGIRNDVARLAGARMVVSVEVDDGKRLAEGLIKQVTGGDKIAARFLHREYFEFEPQFTLWLVANARPRAHANDDALWRRILQVPFTVVIPPAERNPDLKRTLRTDPTEQTAILAWLVHGMPPMAGTRPRRPRPRPQVHRRIPTRKRCARRLDRRPMRPRHRPLDRQRRTTQLLRNLVRISRRRTAKRQRASLANRPYRPQLHLQAPQRTTRLARHPPTE